MNKVILMGRLTRDVEMRQTPSGVNLARFTIAINRRFSTKDSQQTDFINCVAWRQTAEFISRYFGKGSMIAIVGNIQSRSWDGQDGKRQYATEVVVDEAYFTGSRAETSGGGQQSYGGGQPNYGGGQPNYGGGQPNYGGGQQSYGGGQSASGYNPVPQSNAPSSEPNFDEFDTTGFDDFDGSEDDLPF